MPMVQAAILRAVSGLDDSLGISTLTPDVHTVGLCDRMDAAPYRLLPYPSASRRRISGPSCKPRFLCFRRIRGQKERRPKFTGTMARSMQMKENVSFCHNSAQRKSVGGLVMARFLLGMRW
jgi:hypothetical protein